MSLNNMLLFVRIINTDIKSLKLSVVYSSNPLIVAFIVTGYFHICIQLNLCPFSALASIQMKTASYLQCLDLLASPSWFVIIVIYVKDLCFFSYMQMIF